MQGENNGRAISDDGLERPAFKSDRRALTAGRLASCQRPQFTPVLTSTTDSATDVGHFCRSRDGGVCHHKMMTKTKDADESKQYKGGMLELMFPTAVDVGQAT
jgi:hypothetical protein